MDTQETIGERVQRLRRERGLTLRQLGGGVVSHAYISRIEAGTREASVAVLRTLAARLEVAPELLEHGVEPLSRDRVESALADAELALRLGTDPDVRSTLEQIAAEADRLGDRALLTRATALAGLAAAKAGDHDVAIAHLEAATAQPSADPVADPDLFVTLGGTYIAHEREEDAIALFERCLRETEGRREEIAAARIRFATHLSYAIADTGRLAEAAAVLDDLPDEPAPDLYSRVRLEWARGRLDLMIGRAESGLDHFHRVLELLGQTGDELHRARAEVTCADILAMRGDSEGAAAHLERATAVEELADRADRGWRRAVEALLAVRRGDLREGQALVTSAFELLGGAMIGRGVASLAHALVLLGEGDLTAARKAAADGLAVMERTEGLDRAAAFCREWGAALAAAGRSGPAQTAHSKAAELQERHLAQLAAFAS